MNLINIFLTLLLIVLPVSMPNASAQIAGNIPMVRLLSTPEKFNGKRITTSGILKVLDGDKLSLFMDSDSGNYAVTSNAFVLLLSEKYSENISNIKKMSGEYVLISAKFDVSNPLPRGYSGILSDVDDIRSYPLIKKIPYLNPEGAGP